MRELVKSILENNIGLGILCYALIVTPILGISFIHKK
jgi:hypothetical protein